ncbi:MAG: acyl-CoA thioesterase [Oligoflexia bacterium]|nr:acyl-CoA thioesterase [Oligoflexia bacterium]
MKKICHLYYRVPFSETDAMGIVHHSNHAKYFERGRVEFLRLMNFPYSKIVEKGFHFPVTALNVQFKKPIYFDDCLLIETKISKLTNIRLNFSYSLYRTENLNDSSLTNNLSSYQALVLGETQHCCVNTEGRPVEMSSELFEIVNQYWESESIE